MANNHVFKDKYGNLVQTDSFINIHQTVNGESHFYIWDLDNLDVRYTRNLNRKYEYDVIDLLSPSELTGETEFEILNP